MKHIFIAINFPKEIKQKLISLQNELSGYFSYVRWVKPENIHLTLAFLGYLEQERLEVLNKVLKELIKEVKLFSLSLRGLGIFPEEGRPKIIWVSVVDDIIPKSLNQTFYRKLTQSKFNLDERIFTPHITIGRFGDQKPSKEAINFVLSKFKETSFGQTEVKSIEIMESRLRRTGSIYSVVGEIKLESQN